MKHPPNINSDQVKNTLMTALVRWWDSAAVRWIRWVSKGRVNMDPRSDSNININEKKIVYFVKYILCHNSCRSVFAPTAWLTKRLDRHSHPLIRRMAAKPLLTFWQHHQPWKHDFCLVKGRNLLHWSLFGTGESSLWHVKYKKWNGF